MVDTRHHHQSRFAMPFSPSLPLIQLMRLRVCGLLGMSRDWNEEFQMVMKSHREELLTPRGRFVDVGELARQDHFVSAPFNLILLAGKSKARAFDHIDPPPNSVLLRS